MLGEAYAHDIALCSGMPESQRLEVLVRRLNADPALLIATWDVWSWEMAGWSEARVMNAWYWLDALLIGELAHP